MIKQILNWLLVILIISGFSCTKTYTPKPRGYLRIDFPKKNYTLYDSSEPFIFEYPVYAEVVPDKSENSEPHWININFPEMNGTIYLSYKNVKGNLEAYVEDSRNFVYKHVIKADQIPETPVVIKKNNVYGIFYDIKGNVASSVQFFLTDSTRHFIRGSLYFDAQPDKDSLAPVINFVREDIIHMINTFQWKE